MAKPLLLRGDWVKPAAALLLSLALSADLFATRAFAEADGALTNSPAADNAGPAGKKPEEDKKPAADAAKEKPANLEPAEPKDAKPQAPAAEAKPAPAKPAGAKSTGAKPTDAKSTDAKPTDAKPAAPKETKAEKPRDLTQKIEGPGDLSVRASTVDAVYHISWLGAYIGDFKIRSSITNRQYSLSANADISVFFGSFTWRAATTSNGLMTANGPMPRNWMFRYAAGSRGETVELRFQQRMVQDILINPPQHPGARRVPITAAHLQNVVDPLSAIVLLSQARLSRGDACNKRLPIFDGKIRYDLVLSPKGTRSIGSSGKLRGTAYVCSVSYVPIAGHKMGKQSENDYAAGNTGIEVWLVPLPEAGLLVPYYVHVPTPAGTASMVSATFDVQTPAGRHAAAE